MHPNRQWETLRCDVLVIGAGAAGLSAALAAREAGADVLVVSATRPETASATAITQVAGAFISAALGNADPRDNPDIHFEDTVTAGQCLSEQPLVWHYTHNVFPAIERLERIGVAFKRDVDGRLLQFHSPGHRYARTLAFGPGAGKSLAKVMVEAAEAAGVRFLPNLFVTRLLQRDGTVIGAAGLCTVTDEVKVVLSKATILATGGAGLLYPRTGIPPATAGAGFALALEAGAPLIDMELVQWYPTALAEEGQPPYLVHYDYFLSHGARLVDSDGEDLLAKSGLSGTDVRNITRDQLSVALGRAVRSGALRDGRALLDLSDCPVTIDHPVLASSPYVKLVQERLGRPGAGLYVAPTAHYFMGGVLADPFGCTAVPGLYVCGEAVGGVHGANRLQGNSLTDGLVGGHSAGLLAAQRAAGATAHTDLPAAEAGRVADDLQRTQARDGSIAFAEYLEALRTLMVTKAGLVRDRAGLMQARDQLSALVSDLPHVKAVGTQQKGALAVMPAVLTTARCIIEASLVRHASCGAFYLEGAPPTPDGSHLYHVEQRLQEGSLQSGRRPVDRSIRPDLGGWA